MHHRVAVLLCSVRCGRCCLFHVLATGWLTAKHSTPPPSATSQAVGSSGAAVGRDCRQYGPRVRDRAADGPHAPDPCSAVCGWRSPAGGQPLPATGIGATAAGGWCCWSLVAGVRWRRRLMLPCAATRPLQSCWPLPPHCACRKHPWGMLPNCRALLCSACMQRLFEGDPCEDLRHDGGRLLDEPAGGIGLQACRLQVQRLLVAGWGCSVNDLVRPLRDVCVSFSALLMPPSAATAGDGRLHGRQPRAAGGV